MTMRFRFYLALTVLLFFPISASLAQVPTILPDANYQVFKEKLQPLSVPPGGVFVEEKDLPFSKILDNAKEALSSQPLYKSSKVEAVFYETAVIGPMPADIGIILFSDDGVSLFVKEVTLDSNEFAPEAKPVFAKYGEGQHLPDLDGSGGSKTTSFHLTSVVMKKDRRYRIALAYSNIVHPNVNDTDGLTVYLYNVNPVDLDVNTNMDAKGVPSTRCKGWRYM